jgi:catechol 2,3-dioxygenase-like lactoylglutathione lyase family enzyme
MIQQVHHVMMTIPVGLEKQAREFYCETLGLTEIEKPASLAGRGGFWLQVGNLQIHVGTENSFDRMSTKGHIAWQVDDLAAWPERLATWGIVPLESIPIEGFDRFEFRDPFGNRVEFIQPVSRES